MTQSRKSGSRWSGDAESKTALDSGLAGVTSIETFYEFIKIQSAIKIKSKIKSKNNDL